MKEKSMIEKECHVCVCGGGVTGLSIALEIAQTNPNKKVMVLESGGVGPGLAQVANVGKIIGNDVYALEASRMRALSGTQWFWGGNSRPLDPIDFERRDWIDNSGWPISYDEFIKFVKPATLALDIDDVEWDKVHSKLVYPEIDENSEFEHTHFKLSPQIVHSSSKSTGTFYQSNEDLIKRQSNLEIVVDCTLYDFEFDTVDNSVKKSYFMSTAGKTVAVKADVTVMAMGCLENSRVLKFISEKSGGITLPGEKNIGKYFMEHPHGALAKLIISDDQTTFNKNAFGIRIGTAVHQTRFRLKDAYQKQNQLLNFGISTIRSSDKHLKGLEELPVENLNHSTFMSEQEPLYSNGITFENEKDMFGIPQINLRWELSDKIYENINYISDRFSEFLLMNDLGRPQMYKYKNNRKIGGGHHHMGTTRMGHSADKAVTDSDCKVFGVKNLFMAGGSVFPTSGTVNPTINMLILGYRLANHLKEKYLNE